MHDISSRYRTDEQLQLILYETADWAIHGRPGLPTVQHGASLYDALTQPGTPAALTRRPKDDIIVFRAQIERLRNVVGGWDGPPISQKAYMARTKTSGT